MPFPKRSALALAAVLLAGCSSSPPMKPEPVDVSGVLLTATGQPVKDVTIQFIPTNSDQQAGGAAVKADGKFSSKLTPGKYTFALEGKNAPAAYTTNKPEHSFEVPSGGSTNLEIKLQ